jgi:hypothetical protein
MRATQNANEVATGVPVQSAGAIDPVGTLAAIDPFPTTSC